MARGLGELLEDLARGVYEGRRGVRELASAALDQGVPPSEVVSALIEGMHRVGRDFALSLVFVPEVLVASRAMKEAMEVVAPRLGAGDVPRAGKAVLGTVRGDLHDIGKHLVGVMWEAAGFEVIDFGVDVSPEAFVDEVRTHRPALVREKPDILGMSALLTTTMPQMAQTVRAMSGAGVRELVKVMVGGATVTQAFAERIGADGWAPDAGQAAIVARRLIGAGVSP